MNKQAMKDTQLRDSIFAQLALHPSHGYRRIALQIGVGKKRIERNMRIFGIHSTNKRKRFPSQRRHSVNGVPNLLLGVRPDAADVIWAGDFTHFVFHRRIIYLSVVLDTYTREVIAWEIAYHHKPALIIHTLEHAARRRKKVPSIFHSDQGSEYTSDECIAWLKKNNIQPSHSWKGRPWQNGIVESFLNSLKREFGYADRFPNTAKLFEGIAEWIDYYNYERVHSSLNMSPCDFSLRAKVSE